MLNNMPLLEGMSGPLIQLFTYVLIIFIGYFAFEIYLMIYRIIRNGNICKEINNDLDIFKRDIDCTYSPAIASILYYGKIRWKKTLVANIINLYCKGILKIEHNNNKIKFKVIKDETNQNDISKSDKILLDYIENSNHGNKLNYKLWKKALKEEYKQLNFTKEMDISDTKMILTIIFVSLVAIIILCFTNDYGVALNIPFGLMIGTAITIMFSVFWKRNKFTLSMNLNDAGKQELKKWIKFKKFMEEYTLMKDREIEEVVLYEEYLPYSIALGVNKKSDESLQKVFDNETLLNIQKVIKEDINSNPIMYILAELGIR